MSPKPNLPVLDLYNPLDKQNIGVNIVKAFLETEDKNLPPEAFIGAGVYALYYTGPFPLYQTLVDFNACHEVPYPIYVGKAVPTGARKGVLREAQNQGTALFGRLTDHANSIIAAQNLDINDFRCKYMAVDDIWIPLTESILIDSFKPLWNCVLEGFGNHDPGKGRYQGKMSSWDCIHIGRAWASRLQPCIHSEQNIMQKVQNHLEQMFSHT